MTDYTTTVVPRRRARDVLDLIRGHDLDGKVFPVEITFDGTLVEGIGYDATPPGVEDPEEMEVIVLAIVVDDDLAASIGLPPGDDDSPRLWDDEGTPGA